MDLLLLAQDVTWDGRAGDAVHLRELAQRLAHRGHRVRVVARGDPSRSPAGVDGVEVYPLASSLDLAFNFVRKPLVVESIVRLVRRRRPDVVYSRGFGDPSEAIVVHALGLPLVFEVNGDFVAEREAQLGRPFPRWHRTVLVRAARVGFRLSRAVIAVTETLQRLIVDKFGVPPEKVHVVGNAADTDRFQPGDPRRAKEELGLRAETPIVLFVGNLATWQGVDVLLHAFVQVASDHTGTLLLVVGDGPESERLRALAGRLGLRDGVRFTGRVSTNEVRRYIAAADVCVAPMNRERLRSGSSAIKVYEYLAGARPVVASRIPGLEFLEREDSGRLVPPEDPAALAAAVSAALSDARWRERAGHRGREYVLANASWASVVDRVERVCRTVMA